MKIKLYDWKEISLQSERLTLEPLDQDFAEQFFKGFTPAVAAYTKPQPHKNVGEVVAYIRSQMEKMEQGEDLNFAILSKSREFLGAIGLHELNSDAPVIGLWLNDTAQGKGYGREAMTLVIAFLREHFAYAYLKFPADRRNTISKRIPEAFGGMVQKEYLSQNDRGEEMDIVEYWIDYFPQKGLKAESEQSLKAGLVRILENAKLIAVATSAGDNPNIWLKSFVYDDADKNKIYLAVRANHRMLGEFSASRSVAAIALPVVSVESVRVRECTVIKSIKTAKDMKQSFLRKYPLYAAERPSYDSYEIYEIHFAEALVTLENGRNGTVTV